jgi:hypothetical protein
MEGVAISCTAVPEILVSAALLDFFPPPGRGAGVVLTFRHANEVIVQPHAGGVDFTSSLCI